MENICPQEQCTGCSACMNVCPVGAISIQPTGPLKHMHPIIEQDKCIDCHLCEKTCPVNHPKELTKPIAAYAAIRSNYEDLMSSSSGGAAAAVAEAIVDQGGVVYGCVQENYRTIQHQRIDNKEELYKLKGSKYVQSDIGYIFKAVQTDLKQGIPVLFTGTPCQIAGLKAFLRKEYENLYLVDLVCHGIPSQHLLQENVESIVGPGTEAYVHFRRKGEPPIRMYGVFLSNCPEVSEKKQVFLKNDYITAFMNGLTFRENCYSCRYAGSARISDITVADYWGIGSKSTIRTDYGVSLILQNTQKGERLINMIQNSCHIEKRDVEEAVHGNGQLQTAHQVPINREQFLADYAREGAAAYSKHLKDYKRMYIRSYRHPHYGRFGLLGAILRRIPGLHALYLKIKNR